MLPILVVDDEPLILMEVAEILRNEGFEVVAASNADDAWKLLQADRSFRLVCTDVRMPGSMDGIGLAKRICSTFPDLPVIIISGEVTARHIPHMGHARLTKPVDPSVLVATVKRLLPV